MTSLDAGIYGAKVQSLEEANPWELLRRLIEENGAADEKVLLSIYRDYLKGDEGEEYLDACILYSFTNGYRALMHRPTARASSALTKAVKPAKVEAIKKMIKARAARMVLLDLVLPNGKALRDCTGKDCAKFGGWFTRIAGQVKPSEIVGKVMSEAQVQKLYREYK